MDSFHIRYLTKASRHHRLIGHHDCQVTGGIDLPNCFYCTVFQLKLVLLIDQPVFLVDRTVSIQKNRFLLLGQTAATDKSAGQFTFRFLNALHSSDVFDIFWRMITINWLPFCN